VLDRDAFNEIMLLNWQLFALCAYGVIIYLAFFDTADMFENNIIEIWTRDIAMLE